MYCGAWVVNCTNFSDDVTVLVYVLFSASTDGDTGRETFTILDYQRCLNNKWSCTAIYLNTLCFLILQAMLSTTSRLIGGSQFLPFEIDNMVSWERTFWWLYLCVFVDFCTNFHHSCCSKVNGLYVAVLTIVQQHSVRADELTTVIWCRCGNVTHFIT